ATGEELTRLAPRAGFVTRMLFSPDGNSLLTARYAPRERPLSSTVLTVWDVATGKERHGLVVPFTRGPAVAFSRDGTLLAAAATWPGEEPVVRLWDAATGEPRRTLKGHAGPVVDLAFTAGGQRLLTAGADGTIKLWDAASTDGALRSGRAGF